MPMRVNRINPASLRNLQAFIRDLPNTISESGSRAIRDAAKMYAEALKEAIYHQTYADAYAPLSEDYLLRKISTAKTSNYPAFWLFDEELVDSIEVIRRGTGQRNMSYVVGFNNDKHRSGYTNAELAQLLEYGGAKLPARAVVEPTWEEFKEPIKAEVLRIFQAGYNRRKFAKLGR